MSNFNLTETEREFIKKFIAFWNGIDDDFYLSMDLFTLEKILSILGSFGMNGMNNRIYSRIEGFISSKKSEIARVTREELDKEVEKELEESKKNKTQFNFKR